MNENDTSNGPDAELRVPTSCRRRLTLSAPAPPSIAMLGAKKTCDLYALNQRRDEDDEQQRLERETRRMGLARAAPAPTVMAPSLWMGRQSGSTVCVDLD